MAKADKKPRLDVTITGELLWPKLDVPDVYQPLDKKGKPKGEPKVNYITNIRCSDAEHKRVKAILEEALSGSDFDNPTLPIKKNKEDKTLSFLAKSGKDFKPPAFDARNRRLPDDVAVGGGTKAKVNCTVNVYDGFGGGINLYINALQVLELVEKTFGKSPFEETEGYSHEGNKADGSDDNEWDEDGDDEGAEDHKF
jgi:hypothetical protein